MNPADNLLWLSLNSYAVTVTQSPTFIEPNFLCANYRLCYPLSMNRWRSLANCSCSV